MKIAALYSFNNGQEVVEKKHPKLLAEVRDVITAIDASIYKNKISKEKTRPGKRQFSPKGLNGGFKKEFGDRGWVLKREVCEYPTEYYVEGYTPAKLIRGAYREMDFIKDKLGVEVQFGKYSFMVYNVAAKMTIFKNLGHIDTGIEIVPVKKFASEMSTGVSYFEQFVWDLTQRGISNIDIPVLIIGIDAD